MKLYKLSYLFFVLVIFPISSYIRSAEHEIRGDWTAVRKTSSLYLQLYFKSNQSSVTLPLTAFSNLKSSEMDDARQLNFELKRDPGFFRFVGDFYRGKGAGEFTFVPEITFPEKAEKLGYERPTNDQLLNMAEHNLTTGYLQALYDFGFRKLTSEQLEAMMIHDVSTDYIRRMRVLGYKETDPEDFIAAKIHDVTPEYVLELERSGYRNLSFDELKEMQIHEVTAEYIRELHRLGYNPKVAELIEMKIHDVTPEFVSQHRTLSVDELVDLVIHGEE